MKIKSEGRDEPIILDVTEAALEGLVVHVHVLLKVGQHLERLATDLEKLSFKTEKNTLTHRVTNMIDNFDLEQALIHRRILG